MLMKSSIRILALALCCWTVTQVPTVAHSQPNPVPPPRVELPGSQMFSLSSSIVGREYSILVQLPGGYGDTTRSFPVVFVLDAQWDFPLVGAIYGSQYYDGFVPALIIVGITWGGANPNHDSLRAADLTPTHARQVPQSGNAPQFLSFIKTELIPFIESRFRTAKDDRTLMGSSYGGLFTLYAMFQETGLFRRYVLTSPALGFDNGVLSSYEKSYAEGKSSLPVRLFMAQGALEREVEQFERFVEQMKSRSYQGLHLQTRILENIGHSGSKAEGYTRGMQWVFERPSLSLPPAVLKEYEGVYEIRPGLEARVTVEGARLSVQVPGNPTVLLHTEGNDRFYVKGFFLNAQFRRDAAGKVTSIDVEEYSGSTFLKKIGGGS